MPLPWTESGDSEWKALSAEMAEKRMLRCNDTPNLRRRERELPARKRDSEQRLESHLRLHLRLAGG